MTWQVVIDLAHFTSRLPEGIAGFFYMTGTSEHDRAQIRREHSQFISQYHFPNQHAPPLMEFNLAGGGDSPFTLVPAEHTWAPGEG